MLKYITEMSFLKKEIDTDPEEEEVKGFDN